MNALHLLPGCRVERIHLVDPSGLQQKAQGVRVGARCPACGVWSEMGLLVDLESRRAVDLLPDRRAETLAA